MEHELHLLDAWASDVQERKDSVLVPLQQVVELQFGDLTVGLLDLFVEFSLLNLFVPVFLKFLELFLDVLDVTVISDDVAWIDLALEKPFVRLNHAHNCETFVGSDRVVPF